MKMGRVLKGKALQYEDRIGDDDASSKMYRFKVLLPNGLSTNVSLLNPSEEMSVHDLLVLVKNELNNTPTSGGSRPRELHWEAKIYLTDMFNRNITEKIRFSNYDNRSLNILKLEVSLFLL